MDLLESLSTDSAQQGPEQAECSRKGCRLQAQWQVKWNNPKIHTPERRKVWLACAEHREWLENFLKQRLFWRSTEPLETGTASVDGEFRG